MKKPTLERGPNVSIPISDPQITITSGVRQRKFVACETPFVVAMCVFPQSDRGKTIKCIRMEITAMQGRFPGAQCSDAD